jgi:hypothetical protein
MSFLLRMMIPLIGYVCVATVVTGALGFGYLRKSGKLNDETLYRIVALVHGVDLDEIEQAQEAVAAEAPPEEPSFAEQQQFAQAATIQFDAKQKQLASSLLEFDHQLKRLTSEANRYTMLGDSVKQELETQKQMVLNQQIIEVSKQIESMDPDTQAKPMLALRIEQDRLDEVILLLNNMKPRSRTAILNTFTTEQDIENLYKVQRKMLEGGQAVEFINERLQELEQLKNRAQ